MIVDWQALTISCTEIRTRKNKEKSNSILDKQIMHYHQPLHFPPFSLSLTVCVCWSACKRLLIWVESVSVEEGRLVIGDNVRRSGRDDALEVLVKLLRVLYQDARANPSIHDSSPPPLFASYICLRRAVGESSDLVSSEVDSKALEVENLDKARRNLTTRLLNRICQREAQNLKRAAERVGEPIRARPKLFHILLPATSVMIRLAGTSSGTSLHLHKQEPARQ